MNKIDKIKSIIKKHQKELDKHFVKYRKAEQTARARLSESAFKTEFMQETYPKFVGEAQAAADIAVLEVNNIFDEIQDDLSEWMMKPLDIGTAQILSCINQFSLQMSFDELRILEQGILKSGSYLGNRIFDGLCKKNGYMANRPTLKTIVDSLQISVNAPMKYTLDKRETERMKKSLEKIVDKKGEIDASEALRLKESDPDFINKLRSMPEHAFEAMDVVTNFFHLDSESNKKKDLPYLYLWIKQHGMEPFTAR